MSPSAPSPPSPAAPAVASAGSGPVAAAGFARLIDGFRGRLDGEIAAFLAAKRAAAAGLAGTGGRAEPAAAGDLPGDPADLIDGVARLMAVGGKRLRPALVYYTYGACGGGGEQLVLPLALATEFLHTYLLIHDDIMDHAEVRRGQPAAHARFRDLHRAGGLRGDADDFGRSVAILLGDLAHTYAVELFTSVAFRSGAPAAPATPAAPGTPGASGTDTAAASPDVLAAAPGLAPPAPHWSELNRCFSQMCEEVIGGQYLEYLLAHRWHADAAGTVPPEAGSGFPAPRATALAAREAELLRVLRLKSGRYTAERPIQLGALLAGAPARLRAELSRYGTAVGEAFQLQDDMLGMFGDPDTVGKPVGDDLREGKFTLLIHHALANGSPAERRQVNDALGDPDLTPDTVARVQQVLERTGARRSVTAMIAERLGDARRALAALATLAPPAPPAASTGLAGAAAYAADRQSARATEGLSFLTGLLDYLWEREQ